MCYGLLGNLVMGIIDYIFLPIGKSHQRQLVKVVADALKLTYRGSCIVSISHAEHRVKVFIVCVSLARIDFHPRLVYWLNIQYILPIKGFADKTCHNYPSWAQLNMAEMTPQ